MELNLLALSIGIGLVTSLFFAEFLGLAAGGLVVPGYMALYMTRPAEIAVTIAAALLTFFLVRIASTFVIVYGRRRTALMILVGYVMGVLLTSGLEAIIDAGALPGGIDLASRSTDAAIGAGREAIEAGVIGYILPGLIAIWLDRQGIVPTLAALVTSAVVVRLILILTVPEQLQWFEAAPDPISDIEEVMAR